MTLTHSARLPEPGIVAAALVFNTLLIRRLVVRHLMLPRLFPFNRHASAPGADGRMHIEPTYGNFPFYVKPTLWNRWGPEAWLIWLAGGKLPGDDAEYYLAKGFRPEDIGPRDRMGKGLREMEKDFDRMKGTGMQCCPFR
jgi:hypothetical protein